ncbi:hypothetical protein NIES3974_36680 [Calothrix sp. NIES-3974]|nr:hypothetical protein NIES3974_36680 [Calothrix sp. NIES-3974]
MLNYPLATIPEQFYAYWLASFITESMYDELE